MKVGYCRVSTLEQKLDLQRDALEKAGCERIFEEQASGANDKRAALAETLAFLREDDILVVWRLDRLARSIKHLLALTEEIARRGAHFQTIVENIDTTTSHGRLVFHVLASIAEFERAIIRERSAAGMQAAKARGIKCGRPSKTKNADMAQGLINGGMSAAAAAKEAGLGRSTLFRLKSLKNASLTSLETDKV